MKSFIYGIPKAELHNELPRPSKKMDEVSDASTQIVA
jgi:hypothetical protein